MKYENENENENEEKDERRQEEILKKLVKGNIIKE